MPPEVAEGLTLANILWKSPAMIPIVGRLASKYHNRRLMLKRVRGGLSIFFLLMAGVSLFHLPAAAQFTAYSNEFLNIGAGARGMAMGDAQVASVSDGTAGYWNPAALAGIKGMPQLNLMHAEY